MLQFLIGPFIACLILTGIHAYLGVHVVERKVIFVDLALAQIAALGTALGVIMGFEYGDTQSYFAGLGFTIIGATIFSLTRMRDERVPQEAIIGIVYAVSAAAFVLIMDQAPEGTEKIKGMLVGSILFVDWPTIIKTATLYSLIGVFHFVFRNKFITISLDPERAFQEKIRVRFWDFLFYTSFGFVVTSSVLIAGVLLVFSYLVVPAVCAVLFSENFKTRLIIGWSLGFLASLFGIIASVAFDLPTGAAIVCTFGLILIISAIIRYFMTRRLNRVQVAAGQSELVSER
ncbi:metal ABC transporter permease [candidate division KSB1 bacterium]|nr:metal ABC transporter permease [candidate division KSB1 bacterium]NIR71102.1 metal ABC transporter permease [candidate division KSB1 bacterium]NIS23262.1 metal ABC transporter permease [candidate division KSB1 bacterium]NIT70142.1 metal ABC transporter permease [candidate division KSB1 bacterium]NIU23792.1 metal ABC transporter permease [candidate division KSB1 bacterium]